MAQAEEQDDNMALLDAIVKALEPYDIPTGSWTAAEKAEPAKAVLKALGIEQVGWRFKGNPKGVVPLGIEARGQDYEPIYVVHIDGRVTCPTCNGMDPEDYIHDPPCTLCPTCKGEMTVPRNGEPTLSDVC